MGKGTKTGVDGHTLDLQRLCFQVTEHSPLLMAALEDSTYIVRYVNPAFCRLVSRQSAELIGIPFARAVPGAGTCLTHLDRAYREGGVETCVVQVRPAPDLLYWSYTMWAVISASGRPAGIMVQVTDKTEAELFRRNVTAMNEELMLASVRQHELIERVEKLNAGLEAEIGERRRVERALRVSEEQFRRAIEDAPIPVVMYTEHGEVLMVSNTWTELTGYAVSDMPTLDAWLERVYGQGANTLRAHMPLLFKGEQRTFDTELQIHTRSGENRYWSFSASSPGTLRDGRHFVVGMAQDITKRKRAEQALQEARDELERRVEERTSELARTYEKLLSEIEERERLNEQLQQSQKMEALGTLAGGIAHDFNNMLAVILGNAELVLDDVEGAYGARRNLEQIVKASKRARDLVKQILLFSRKGERGRKALRLTPLVKETYKLLRGTLPSTIHMELDLPAESDTILADPSGIQQILMNLATNAAYAMREDGGTMRISLSNVPVEESGARPDEEMTPGIYVKLTVEDTGTGMTDDVRRRIFEPFFTTKGAGEGTGMGLAVVYGIVKNLDGAITVASEQDRGSTFSVFFPRHDAQTEPEREDTGRIRGGSERILLVDDEPDIIETASQLFQRLGYRVTAVQSGTEALRVFLDDPSRFDLVITDQTMPDLTGIDLAGRILQVRSDTPVILFTGYSEAVSPDTARAAGISEFIMKPISKREVAETIRRLLDRRDRGR
ncbi:MAG: response regulator [Syntrophorhabdales bacterium]